MKYKIVTLCLAIILANAVFAGSNCPPGETCWKSGVVITDSLFGPWFPNLAHHDLAAVDTLNDEGEAVGLFADSALDAVTAFYYWAALSDDDPLKPFAGWVDGTILCGSTSSDDDSGLYDIGTREKYEEHRDELLGYLLDKVDYHIALYNCQDWADEHDPEL